MQVKQFLKMTTEKNIWRVMGIGCCLGIILYSGAVRGADDKAKTESKLPIPDEASFPKSVFDLTPTTIKDPFFPLSKRSAVPIIASTNAEPAAVNASDFLLGLSISSSQSLALINNRTLAEGERGMVAMRNSGAKVGVTVLKIKSLSAIIQVDGYRDPIELFLSKKDQ